MLKKDLLLIIPNPHRGPRVLITSTKRAHVPRPQLCYSSPHSSTNLLNRSEDDLGLSGTQLYHPIGRYLFTRRTALCINDACVSNRQPALKYQTEPQFRRGLYSFPPFPPIVSLCAGRRRLTALYSQEAIRWRILIPYISMADSHESGLIALEQRQLLNVSSFVPIPHHEQA